MKEFKAITESNYGEIKILKNERRKSWSTIEFLTLSSPIPPKNGNQTARSLTQSFEKEISLF